MPWYNEIFDSDLERELDERNIAHDSGGKNSLTLILVQAHKLYGLLKEVLRLWDLIYQKLQLKEQEMFMLVRRKTLIS